MNSIYSIKIEWNPAYEFVVSFYAYMNKKEGKHLALGSKWRKETESMLPSAFARELEDERWEVLHRIVLLIAQSPENHSVESFLDWLGRLPAGEIYERLAPWVDYIPLNLGEIRDRSLYLLSQWNVYYFSKVDRAILQELQANAAKFAAQAHGHDPADVVERATNGVRLEPSDNLRQVILVPQYHHAPATILDFFRGIATCLYPMRPVFGTGTDLLDELLPMTQCLGDEKRLQILRYLASGPKTLSDIQQHVKLAKSTVHHHLTALRRAGMIRSHHVDSSSASCYSLRETFVERLHAGLKRFLRSGRSTQ